MTGVRRARSDPAPRRLDSSRVRAVALDLLARKSWSRRDLARRLERRGAAPDVAEAVVADLEGRGYVDDRSFAETWAEARARERGLGRERLRDELTARGIARSIADAAIARAFSDADEITRATAVAVRRVAALRRRAPDQGARRLHDYLRRRGYPEDVVRQAMRAVRLATTVTEGIDERVEEVGHDGR